MVSPASAITTCSRFEYDLLLDCSYQLFGQLAFKGLTFLDDRFKPGGDLFVSF